jgi:hypothetical protein
MRCTFDSFVSIQQKSSKLGRNTKFIAIFFFPPLQHTNIFGFIFDFGETALGETDRGKQRNWGLL